MRSQAPRSATYLAGLLVRKSGMAPLLPSILSQSLPPATRMTFNSPLRFLFPADSLASCCRFSHRVQLQSTRASFEGLGLYRASGDSVRGSWHDSRGITLAVEGRCVSGTFTSRWSGVERGRTVYQRRGESLIVIDSVYPPNGAGREFGRSVLTRGRM